MFTKVNSKVVSVDVAQSGPVVARRGAMLFYTGDVRFAPHQIAGVGPGSGGMSGIGGAIGHRLAGEHESTILASGQGVVHFGFRGIEVEIVDVGRVGGLIRVEASRTLAYTSGLQASVVSVTAQGGGGGGGGGGLFGSLRSAAAGAVTGQGMFTTQLSGQGQVVILGHGGVFELGVAPDRPPVTVDPQAYVAAAGQVTTTLTSNVSWRNVGRTGGEAMQLQCAGHGTVYVQASEEKL